MSTEPIGYAEVYGPAKAPQKCQGDSYLVTADRMPSGTIRLTLAKFDGKLTWIDLDTDAAICLSARLDEIS